MNVVQKVFSNNQSCPFFDSLTILHDFEKLRAEEEDMYSRFLVIFVACTIPFPVFSEEWESIEKPSFHFSPWAGFARSNNHAHWYVHSHLEIRKFLQRYIYFHLDGAGGYHSSVSNVASVSSGVDRVPLAVRQFVAHDVWSGEAALFSIFGTQASNANTFATSGFGVLVHTMKSSNGSDDPLVNTILSGSVGYGRVSTKYRPPHKQTRNKITEVEREEAISISDRLVEFYIGVAAYRVNLTGLNKTKESIHEFGPLIRFLYEDTSGMFQFRGTLLGLPVPPQTSFTSDYAFLLLNPSILLSHAYAHPSIGVTFTHVTSKQQDMHIPSSTNLTVDFGCHLGH